MIQAYSPLTKGQKLEDGRLAAVAAKYSRTPAQILVRYGIDQVNFGLSKQIKKERKPNKPKQSKKKRCEESATSRALQGWVTLPKSTTPSRIESNFAVFDFKISAGE
jgi:diketogulonate reductase-like aldo/keto reductase